MVKSGHKPILPLKQVLSKQSEHIVDNVFKNLFVPCGQNKFTYSGRRYIQRPDYIGWASIVPRNQVGHSRLLLSIFHHRPLHSMIAALGSASRPTARRTCLCNTRGFLSRCHHDARRRSNEKQSAKAGNHAVTDAKRSQCESNNGIDDLQALVFGWPSTFFGHGNQWLQSFPLFLAQVARIGLPASACGRHGHLLCWWRFPMLTYQTVNSLSSQNFLDSLLDF